MKTILDEKLNSVCYLCGKTVTTGNNVPHSQHKTRRFIRPNIQKTRGMIICTKCLRTINKYSVA
ncbi:TPA: 50S ribosomal protein L28 [Candidatus Berkelbacteria bacterium]|uniref:Ribosomal protein L28, large subunit ribosomal protein L28 n=1 Tax=Berkelbacteria bacterium GW2011_GWE1_39_12 TaxID=1618337 RepID=A0A0G4B2W0_9BACT|nr:MAG: ribosomal protein L28, large subunit ribosomal protein L28 [Berkelbacteria bacterium GW2011_GWE1_39_12]HBO60487.1 50S ribosomal protein L28 [Candidatus Berkelbacteria bacterium]